MNITETINKIDRIDSLIEKLEDKQEVVLDSLLDWIYAERKEVLDYHNTSRYASHFESRDNPPYISLSASLGPNEVVIIAKEHYGDGGSESLCLPLNHLLHPEKVADLIAAQQAHAAALAAENAVFQEQKEKQLLADLKAKYESKP